MTSSRTVTKTKVAKSRSKMAKDPMAVTWTENYSDTIEKYWKRLPKSVANIIVFLSVFILGATVRGEWLHIAAHFFRAFFGAGVSSAGTPDAPFNSSGPGGLPLYTNRLQNWPYYFVVSVIVSYTFFFGIGGFLHWYYYVNRRDRAHEWKCQPDNWLSPELERHEILLGSFSLFIGATISSLVSCYVMNGGETCIYYNIDEYGWTWYFISWPFTFIWQDYLTYWHHRMYHHPLLYRHFHKLHHKYKQPTAFSVTAIHPFEFVHMQGVMVSPMFLFPVHWTTFVTLLMYLYYHGIIDHSGINFKAYWWQPWQPDCIFHDNHHQYFHVNFGFNCELWDKIHGTYRQKDKIYNEETTQSK
ncbi:delta(7)-sterol 5(6)-desaturase ERG3B isoform X2 [Hyalella azteca]|uniref:Delta(7)-sterol 5(6)-desaturase ERG3B isoform X2 n=1 Tax=Hyalella azteca TaxID=294128 RepID=A0A8B7N6G0_HYAAZ|nr:delta(7)-sterol 5(6)-desaturase ERG3B isoform X2 [Hyalella azteca]